MLPDHPVINYKWVVETVSSFLITSIYSVMLLNELGSQNCSDIKTSHATIEDEHLLNIRDHMLNVN